MCGIAGIFNLDGEPLGSEASTVLAMSSTLVHRGPDDAGELAEGPVAFAFRRLSIIDLETGQQPISNASRTIWVMLNGEIYNFVEVREQLERYGYQFRTKSDSEVIVHAYEHYGSNFVDHLRGMFSIAIWDAAQRRLVLVRDRVGKKPLYYAVRGKQLAFASELKALLQWPRLERTIDPSALDQYLALLYVPSPASILKDVRKLAAGHSLVANCDTGELAVHRYWQVSPTPDYCKSFAHHEECLREVLSEAVRIRLRSDVPLGAFLSGGIDSTIIVGLMVRASPVQTFSIAFADPRFDESRYARLAADFLGTSHHEETVDSNNISPDDLTKLVWHMDEPFADSSFIPTYWVSRIARKKVTVALSGDGGDELFGGYTRYRHFKTLERLGALPATVKTAGGAVASGLRKISATLAPAASERFRLAGKAFELSKLDRNDQIQALQTYFDLAGRRRIYKEDWRSTLNGNSNGWQKTNNGRFDGIPAADRGLIKFMTSDFETGMIDDGLVKVDRASMACSLEVRAPFLDHKVIECAMKIPPQFKLSAGKHKIVLKKAFSAFLPPAIATRSKQGFEVPFGQWFQKKQWRGLLIDMLSPQRLHDQNIFDPQGVVSLRDQLLEKPEDPGSSISAYQLRHRVWALLMFQLWHEQFVG